MKSIKLKVQWGDQIEVIAQQAIELATKYNCKVYFKFNNIKLYARADTKHKDILQSYNYLFDNGRS